MILKRISLNQFSKNELENKQKNLLRGGNGCVCVGEACGCLYAACCSECSWNPSYYGGSSTYSNAVANGEAAADNIAWLANSQSHWKMRLVNVL